MQILKKKYKINTNIYYSWDLSVIFFKRRGGTSYAHIPHYHFVKIMDRSFSIIFEKFQTFQGFWKTFTNIYNEFSHFYSIRIKMRGLGYYIDEYCLNYLSFDFNYTSLFYFHVPENIILRVHKRRLLMLAISRSFLKAIVAEILLLKELGPYRLLGLKLPRSIYIVRKRKIVK